MIYIIRDKVGQIGMLRVVPALLRRIKFRRIGGKPFEAEPIGMVLAEISGGRRGGSAVLNAHEFLAWN